MQKALFLIKYPGYRRERSDESARIVGSIFVPLAIQSIPENASHLGTVRKQDVSQMDKVRQILAVWDRCHWESFALPVAKTL
jgi:hypothetical protein